MQADAILIRFPKYHARNKTAEHRYPKSARAYDLRYGIAEIPIDPHGGAIV